MRVLDKNDNELFDSVKIMETFYERFTGLLLRNSITETEGYWFDRCSSVHMFGMRFPIDAIFLDRNLSVVAIRKNLQPWRTIVASS